MKIDSIYYTLQGEGHLAGKPMCFVRFSGCAVDCPIRSVCDEPQALKFNGQDILLDEVHRLIKEQARDGWVCITGGEPTDHAELEELTKFLKRQGYLISIQTAGIKRVPGQWDWLTVSPKTDAMNLGQRYGNELKLVFNNQSLEMLNDYYTETKFWNYYLMPLWKDGKESNLEQTRDLVLQLNRQFRQQWELTLQYHKYFGLR